MSATIQHSMLMWLREPHNQTHIQELTNALGKIRTIPGVTQVLCGPSAAYGWSALDEGFNYGWTITFERAAVVTDYFAHPAHQQAVRVAMTYAARVLGGFFESAS